MKKVLPILPFMLLMILISCTLKEDSTSPDGDGTTDEVITVTYPKSGDSLEVASSFEIKWTSNTSQNITIDFTSDNGKSWASIASNIEDVGSFVWNPIPNSNYYPHRHSYPC